jgi:Adenylate kinase
MSPRKTCGAFPLQKTKIGINAPQRDYKQEARATLPESQIATRATKHSDMKAIKSLLLVLLLVPAGSAFGPNSANHQQVPASMLTSWGVTREARTNQPSFISSNSHGSARRPFENGNLNQLLNQRQRLVVRQSSATEQVHDRPGKPVRIIISGAPASGKGTQCEKIKERYGVVHLSTGDILRAAVAAKTEVGLKAKEYMDSGLLVPDDVIIGVVLDPGCPFELRRLYTFDMALTPFFFAVCTSR